MKSVSALLLVAAVALAACGNGSETTPSGTTSQAGAGHGGSPHGGGGSGGAGGSGLAAGSGGFAGAGGEGGSTTLCPPGEVQCNGNTVETCNAQGTSWDFTETCPFVCSAGSCTGVCSPGSNQCNGANVETCDAQGQWQVTQDCPFVCIGQACSGVCLPASHRCNGNTVEQCNIQGQWAFDEVCQYVCSSGSCSGSCAPNSVQCSGKTIQTCNANGQWVNGQTCQYVCSAGSCIGVCNPGDQQCTGNVPQSCNAQGQWVSGQACPYVCSGGQCTGVCVPTSKQCNSGNAQVCTAQGQWQTTQACPNACVAGDCVGVCVPNSIRCNGTMPQTCNSQGQWVDGQDCPYVCSLGNCIGVCVPNSTQCSGNTPQTCNANGQWVSGAACQYVCLNGSCSGVCTPGDHTCQGSSALTCNAQGQWDSTPCPGAPNATPNCTGQGVCGFDCLGGYDNCNGLPGDGCEVTLATDGLNCGSCNRTCYGATCAASKCQPQVVASGQDHPYDLDLNDEYAYWVNFGSYPVPNYGTTMQAAVVDNIPSQTAYSNYSQVVASNSSFVFWSNWYSVYGEYRIVGRSPTGSPSWGTWTVHGAGTLTLDADEVNVYAGNSADHTIRLMPVAPGTETILHTDTDPLAHGPAQIAVRGSKLFWLGTTRVRSIPTTGGTPTLIDYDINAVDWGGLEADDTHVYWSCRFSAQKTNLYRASHAGGDKTILAQSQLNGVHIDGIAVDDAYVYYTELGATNDVRRVPKTGGTPETIATGLDGCGGTLKVRVNSTFVYWIGGNNNTIMRMVKP